MQLGFDYESLEPATQTFVRDRAARIREVARATAEGVRAIGQYLTEVKARLGHGKFLEWIDREFDWKQAAAYRFMQVYENVKITNLINLEINVSALYLIAAPKTPEPVRVQVIQRAEAGERITRQVALAAITEFRGRGALPVGVSLPQIVQAAKEHDALVGQDTPTPAAARTIAIQTGKAVLDSEGWYQPPIAIERQEAVANTLDLFDLIVGFPESDLLQHTPREVLERFAALREVPEKKRLRGVSLDRFIAWLVEFEHERKKRSE